MKLAEAVSPATVTRSAGVLSLGQDGGALGEAILDAQVPGWRVARRRLPNSSAGGFSHVLSACAVWEAYALAAERQVGFAAYDRPCAAARFGSAKSCPETRRRPGPVPP